MSAHTARDLHAHHVEQPEEIHQLAAGYGQERLARSARDMFITAVIGGVEVSLGGLGAMAILGSALEAAPGLHLYPGLALAGLVFPVGFLFVVMGRSELFTENFLVPVVAARDAGRGLRELLRLWGTVWLGNMVGCAGFSLLLITPGAIGEPVRRGYAVYAAYKLSVSPLGVVASAVLAGMVMTVMTWLLVAVRDTVGRMLVIFAAGYILFATNLAHTVVGASQIFAGFQLAHRNAVEVVRWVALATVGNLVGGAALVTFGRLAQVKAKRRAAGA